MEITFLGHACFRIKGRSATVLADPFDPNMVGLKLPKVSSDIVTISHSHRDHSYVAGVTDVRRVVEGPGEYEISGVSIIGFSSFHDASNGSERGKNTIYVYELDGLRLCHLGDLGHEPSSALIEEIGYVDILMIPVGGFYTIGADIAAKVARDIEAPLVLPMHYSREGLSPELKEKLSGVDDFIKVSGFSYEKTDKLNVKEGAIPEEGQKVILMDQKSS